MCPNVSKWNAKRCVCCTHLCTKTTITSSVNGRQVSIINYNDMDWTSSDLIYVITWNEIYCCMRYVGQFGLSLKTRFYFFCGSFMFLFCLVFAMFCARLFICALWSPAGKGLTSWLSFVVSSVSLSLSHWYPGSGVVLDCIDSWSLHHYLLLWARS